MISRYLERGYRYHLYRYTQIDNVHVLEYSSLETENLFTVMQP